MSKRLISRSVSITTEIQPKGTCILTSLRPELLFKDARLRELIRRQVRQASHFRLEMLDFGD